MTTAPKGYVVAEIDIHDAEAFAAYRAAVPPIVARFGGRYLVRGGAITGVEGETPTDRITIIEFPSLADAQAFIASADYAPVAAIRHKASSARLFLIEGIPA